jgi:hypothetical protein
MMGYPFRGLPGGSSDEGPATLTGLLLVAVATAIFVAALVAAFFHAVELIDQSPRKMPLVAAFELRHNA